MSKIKNVLFVTDILDNFIGRETLGIMYLSAALKNIGVNVFVSNFNIKNALNIISENDIECIAYSITTDFHKKYIYFNNLIKEKFPEIISIFGGACNFFS